MKKLILLFSFILMLSNCSPIWAQQDSIQAQDTVKVKYQLIAPQQSVLTHLYFLQPDPTKGKYIPEIAAKTLEADSLSLEDKIRLIKKLKQILDGRGSYIEIDKIPNDPNFRDSSRNNEHIYVLDENIPEIKLKKVGAKWLYSKETVNQIEDLHRATYPYGTHNLLDAVEYLHLGHDQYFGLYAWQYLGIFSILVFGYIFYRLLKYLLQRFIIKVFAKLKQRNIAKQLIIPIARPSSSLVVILFSSVLIPILQLPVLVNKYVILSFSVIIPFLIIMICLRFVDIVSVYVEKVAEGTESTMDDQLIPLVKKMIKIIIIVVGIVVSMQNLGFKTTGIVAGLGVGGLAIALAAQDTIKNLFGSFTIFVDKPFQIGDWISGSGISGTVEEVGFRSTRVRTIQNSLVYVPNGQIADMTIDNFGNREYRRFRMTLGLTYDCPTDLIETYMEGLKRIIADHPKTKKDAINVYFSNMGAHSLDILFDCQLVDEGWNGEMQAKQELMLEVMKLAEALNVRFAFPTQTLHVEEFPEKKLHTPEYPYNRDDFNHQSEEYFKGKKK